MEGTDHDRNHRRIRDVVVGGLVMAVLSSAAATTATAASTEALPDCSSLAPLAVRDGGVVVPWRSLLDADGVVSGHRMTLRRAGAELTVRTGRRGFSTDVGGGRILVGERSQSGTTITMLDTTRACRLWTRQLDRLAYDFVATDDGRELRFSALDPATRAFEAAVLIDADSGATNAMIDDECTTVCEPNDGEVDPAAFGPAGPARPVPAFWAGGWPRNKSLPFRWRGSNVPPSWAKGPLKAAAADASDSSVARSPNFVFGKGASNSVRYTSALPSFCRYGIACASRRMPSWWAVWLRPHGSDLSWGTLRWCQKKASTGCFDVRRVMLHELGHVGGLNHPSSAGFRLSALETVMHAITPAKPKAGSSRHAFGRCDVATLQELYDVPTKKSRISTCNDVVTKLALSSNASIVSSGGSVKLKANLIIADRSAYGLLRGNQLAARSVRLRYRRAGSSAAWKTAWMKPVPGTGRYEVSLKPRATLELKANFPAPAGEGLRSAGSSLLKVKVSS